MMILKKFLFQLSLKTISILQYISIPILLAFRPLLGPAMCKFEPSCTKFATQSLQQLPFHKACWLILKRLVSCNPFF